MNAECLGLVCRDCGKGLPESEGALTCPDCGAPLRVTFSEASLREALGGALPAPNGASFLRQWRAVLPIGDESLIDRVSLGEAETPLLPSHRYGPRRGVPRLYFKMEQGPTLSLKDRGTALCVLKALESGRRTVCLSSSGNNAASVSAYASRAGLEAVVFVQKHVSPAKIFKSLIYGGRVVRVDGDMAAASRLCSEMVTRRGWFQCGGPQPLPHRGQAHLRLRHRAAARARPGHRAHPLRGRGRAGRRLRRLPRTGRRRDHRAPPPARGGAACGLRSRAFREGRDTVTPVDKKPSLSDAIMNNNPYWGRYCLEAVRASGGTMISVSDADFLRTIRELGREEGLFTEPAGCVSVAALRHLVEMPGFEDPGLTVCNLTGHGLNVPHVAADENEIPGLVVPAVEAVEAFLRGAGACASATSTTSRR